MIQSLIHKLCINPVLSNFIRNILEAGMITVKRNVRRELSNSKNKRIIDLACGTGEFSILAKGRYIGVDLDRKHIEYSKKKYGSESKTFHVQDATCTNYPSKDFDCTFMFSLLHHLSGKDVTSVLTEAKRITKEKIIIVDLVPLKYNIVGKFIYRMDQGKHIRPYKEQLNLIQKIIKVNKSKVFRSGIFLHSFVVCEP